MNVNDFDIPIPQGDMLETIFNRQRDLMEKYHLIEEKLVGHFIPASLYRTSKNKWNFAGPLDINDRASQLRFKDFAWRITEELTEATLSLGEEDETHYLEELIDALHFSVELLIMTGTDLSCIPGADKFGCSFDQSEKEFEDKPGRLKIYAYDAIESLGEAMNRLKLKPWKSTAMLTDAPEFHKSMKKFWAALIDLLKASGFTAETATAMYLNKNAVNQFRIGSNY